MNSIYFKAALGRQVVAFGIEARMPLPENVKILVNAAGVYGVGTACHRAKHLEAGGHGMGADLLAIEKNAASVGAARVAWGAVRNTLCQPSMREVMAHGVPGWERHADTLVHEGGSK